MSDWKTRKLWRKRVLPLRQHASIKRGNYTQFWFCSNSHAYPSSVLRLRDPLLPCDQLVRLLVLCRGLLQDLVRHAHALFGLQAGQGQPVAEILLVVALLRPSHGVLVRGPEARRIGCENLINQDNLAGCGIDAKLKFGVGNDDATSGGVVTGL